MILDSAGFAHRGDQRIASVSTQAKPNYSMKSKAATDNRDLRDLRWCAGLNSWKASEVS